MQSPRDHEKTGYFKGANDMESKNNAAEAWADSGKKAFENFTDTSGKIAESLKNGDLLKTGTDIYRDWLNTQKNIIESAISGGSKAATETTANTNGSPEPAENKTNTAANPFPSAVPEKAAEAFTELLNMQAKAVQTWLDTVKQVSATAIEAVKPATPEATQNPFAAWTDMYQKWNTVYSDLLNTTGSQFKGTSGGFNAFPGFTFPGAKVPAYDQFFAGSQAYAKLAELYQPVFANWQKYMQNTGSTPVWDAEAFSKAFSAEKVRELTDKLFQFTSPDKFKELYADFSKQTEQYTAAWKQYATGSSEQATKFSENWKKFSSDYQEQSAGLSRHFPKVDYNSFKEFNDFGTKIAEQAKQAYAPFARLIPAGKEKDNMEAAEKIQQKLGDYWNGYVELQSIIYASTRKAMEKVIAETGEKFKAGEVPKYDDFYNAWVNKTEADLIKTFGGDEFSRAQGKLLTIGLEIKQMLDKQAEGYLSVLPVLPRSEADELTREVHDLRARVRRLEKALEAKENYSSAAVNGTVTETAEDKASKKSKSKA
ncbi:MAG: poly(R)-hydroxyalkanoic acid synthase subunit PhaE [Bacteroidota bacterium]